jgi:hypothetical protein
VTPLRGAIAAVTVEAHELPGLTCAPDGAGHRYANVHVGVCDGSASGPPVVTPRRPWGVTGVVPGDATSARWDLEIIVKGDATPLDFGGRFVRGKRGDRHTGLAWGELRDDLTFAPFRGAKLRLDTVDAATVRRATKPGHRLVLRLGLTDARGNPRCATVKAPDLVWAVEAR